MKISLENISKKYNRQSILKNFSYTFELGEFYAIKGENGKGKSTLLKIIAGYLSPDSGTLSFFQNDQKIVPEIATTKISFVAPYIDLPNEMKLGEWFTFYGNFKNLVCTKDDFFNKIELKETSLYKDLSSGMRQRFRLALAFHTASSLLLLDEPCSFLDERWRAKYHQWINDSPSGTTLILSSNDADEAKNCRNIIEL